MRTLLLLLTGCNVSVVYVGDPRPPMQEVAAISSVVNRDLDLLFLVDDSPSMLDKQTSMLASFPNMMDQLESLDGGLPNVHIGVVTSDLGASATNGAIGTAIPGSIGGCEGRGKDGALQTFGTTNLTGKFLSDVEDGGGGRVRNYTGALRDTFTQMASGGGNGCGFEQSLGAVQRAIEPSNVANAGFLRPLANLAIVILSDEDDCTVSDTSLFSPDPSTLGPLQSFRCTRFGVTCDDGGTTPDEMNQVGVKSGCHASTTSSVIADVQPMIEFVKSQKADSSQIMVAALVGDPSPVQTELRAPDGGSTAIPALSHSCQFDGIGGIEVADPAVRTAQFAAGFGLRGSVSSVCSADLSLPLTQIGLSAKALMGDPCIGVALAHPEAPTCELTDGGAPLPSCDTSTGDCWRIVADPVRCAASPDQLRVEIVRTVVPTEQWFTHVRCETAP